MRASVGGWGAGRRMRSPAALLSGRGLCSFQYLLLAARQTVMDCRSRPNKSINATRPVRAPPSNQNGDAAGASAAAAAADAAAAACALAAADSAICMARVAATLSARAAVTAALTPPSAAVTQ